MAKIVLYTEKDITGSIYLMCTDLKESIERLYPEHQVSLATDFKELPDLRPDLLVNFIPGQVLKLQKSAGRFFYCGKLVTLFAPNIGEYSRPELAMILVAAEKTPIIAHSPQMHVDLCAAAKNLLSPALARRFVTNGCVLMPYGVRDSYQFTRSSDKTKFIAPFTRCVEEKGFSTHQKVTTRTTALFAQHGCEMTTTLYKSSNKLWSGDQKNLQMYEVKEVVADRSAYASELTQYAQAISCSKLESFGLFYVELLLSGVVVSFLDAPWVTRLLPNYRFRSEESGLPGVTWHIHKRYEEALDYVEREVVPFIRQNYLIDIFAQKLVRLFV